MKRLTASRLILVLALLHASSLPAEESTAEVKPAGQSEAGVARKSDVVTDSSPDFLLGKQTRPNFFVLSRDNPDMGIFAGIRLQGTAEVSRSHDQVTADIYDRRARLEFGAQFSKDMSFVMDLRNDNANRGDGGERQFNIGDAYVVVRNVAGGSLVNFKGLRGKVDVSRSETVKSSWLTYYDRPYVADEAAQYVSHNRRATNLQLFGDYKKKVHYSLAVGDGVQSTAFNDARGARASAITRQNPMIGAKIVLSPFDGWEERERTETYFGVGKHLSFGAGFFYTGDIRFRPVAAGPIATVHRRLLNVEASAHYENWFVQVEYFRFYDVVESFSAATLNLGESEGWYAQAEYVAPWLAYVGVFYRHERWNRFLGVGGYEQISHAAGLNWYLRGNTVRVGFVGQTDTLGSQLGGATQVAYKLTSQLHF